MHCFLVYGLQQAISTSLITSQLQVDTALDRVAEHRAKRETCVCSPEIFARGEGGEAGSAFSLLVRTLSLSLSLSLTHTHVRQLQYCEILYKYTERYARTIRTCTQQHACTETEGIYMPVTKRSASILHCPSFSPPVTTSTR